MPTVAEFLIERIGNAGVGHVFGVTGEYICDFFKQIQRYDGVSLIPTADEAGAAYAADAYARVKGVGCVAVTYNTGAFKVLNAVAGAYAERSPLIVISGAPGVKEKNHPGFSFQRQLFEKVTCATAVLSNPSTAGFEIDSLLEAMKHHKQPIYIELPRDIADRPIAYDVYKQGTPQSPTTDVEILDEAISEIRSWVLEAKNPVVLVGVEVARFGLGAKLLKFAERTGIPIASTLLSKSVIPEQHPLHLGVYSGSYSRKGVQQAVEESDCLLMLGVMSGDMALSYIPTNLHNKNVVSCTVEELKIKNHAYRNVQFSDFVQALMKIDIGPSKVTNKPLVVRTKAVFKPEKKTPITIVRLFEKIDSILTENMTVVADVGNSMFGAAELNVHQSNGFLGHALYGSMGTAIPGALGAALAGSGRPIVIVGDGSFQMSSHELSSIAANKLNPIVVVLNNGGYGAEQLSCDASFNGIPSWKYHRAVDLLGVGCGSEVQTEEELDDGMRSALQSAELYILNVHLSAGDNIPAIKSAKGLSRKL